MPWTTSARITLSPILHAERTADWMQSFHAGRATKEVVHLCSKALQSRGKSARWTDLSPDDPKDSVSSFSIIALVLMKRCNMTGTRARSGGRWMRRDSAGCKKDLLPGVPERGCCNYIRMTRTIQESLQRRPWHYDPSALDTTIAKALSTFIRPTS